MKLTGVLLLSCLFIFTASTYCQSPSIEWQTMLGGGGGDYAHAIEQTSDGGYIIAGYSESINGDVTGNHGTTDVWVVKLNNAGTMQWQKSFGGAGWDEGMAIHQTTDGGYMVAGYTLSNDGNASGNHGGMDYWLLKLDGSGNLQWQRTFGGSKNDYALSMQLTPDGGCIMAGHSESSDGDVTGNNGNRDYWIVKVTGAGSIQWQKNFGGSDMDEAYSISVAPDGYYISGWTNSTNGQVAGNHGKDDAWVLKLNLSGDLLWKKCLGGSQFERGWSVRTTPDGGCVVAGFSGSNDGDVSGNHLSMGGFADFWVVRLDASGTMLWQKCVGGMLNVVAYTIDNTPDGGFIVGGSAESPDGDVGCNAGWTDYWIVKLNSAGDLQWAKPMGGTSAEEIYAAHPTADGGFIMTGFSSSSNLAGYHPNTGSTAGDFWTIKLSNVIVPVTAPKISIATASTNVCFNAQVVFTANVINGGIGDTYQWTVNGVNAGPNSPTFTTTSLNNGDVVKCRLSYKTGCGGASGSVESNTITMIVRDAVMPEVTVAASAVSVCAGTPITFTATNKSNSPSPSYQWSVNGTPVGTDSPVFTSSTLANNSVVVCRMTVPQCIGTTKDDSDPITVSVKPFLNPSIIIATTMPTVCASSVAYFTAKATDAGTAPHYRWQINGIDAGNDSPTFSTSALVDGDVVNCVLIPDAAAVCSNTSQVKSNSIKVAVTAALPTSIQISASDNGVCEGSVINFTAVVQNAGSNPQLQWEVNGKKAGTNSTSFSSATLRNGDEVTCVLTAANTPCALAVVLTSNNIHIVVKPKPLVSISPSDTSVMAGTELQLKATVGGSQASFQWSPTNRLANPQSLTPTTVPLQETTQFQLLVKGSNGCEAAAGVKISIRRKLFMPDSFTPNGDGKNDVFRIPAGVALDLKEFAIFDRWGNKLFATHDINQGWDGRYNGQALDANTYVYSISGKEEGRQVAIKGTVTLIR